MAVNVGWRTSLDRTATLPVETMSWSGAAAEQRTTEWRNSKVVAIPLAYRMIAMMLAVFLALRSKS